MKEWSKEFYENIKIPFVKCAVNMGITANQITILNHAITLTFGCYFFSRGTYIGGLLGLGVMCINGLLDYLDGDLARINKTDSQLGNWLDSGFDVVIQNTVLGAIAIGCWKSGMELTWVVLFFIGNSSNNYVSFYYNAKFGFDSAGGSKLFRKLMDGKPNFVNEKLKQMVDPTSDRVALLLYTYRYFIAIGAITGNMVFCFMIMTTIANIRWVVMYIIYALYLKGYEKLHILNVLKLLDDEQEEFYSVRHRK